MFLQTTSFLPRLFVRPPPPPQFSTHVCFDMSHAIEIKINKTPLPERSNLAKTHWEEKHMSNKQNSPRQKFCPESVRQFLWFHSLCL